MQSRCPWIFWRRWATSFPNEAITSRSRSVASACFRLTSPMPRMRLAHGGEAIVGWISATQSCCKRVCLPAASCFISRFCGVWWSDFEKVCIIFMSFTVDCPESDKSYIVHGNSVTIYDITLFMSQFWAKNAKIYDRNISQLMWHVRWESFGIGGFSGGLGALRKTYCELWQVPGQDSYHLFSLKIRLGVQVVQVPQWFFRGAIPLGLIIATFQLCSCTVLWAQILREKIMATYSYPCEHIFHLN